MSADTELLHHLKHRLESICADWFKAYEYCPLCDAPVYERGFRSANKMFVVEFFIEHEPDCPYSLIAGLAEVNNPCYQRWGVKHAEE